MIGALLAPQGFHAWRQEGIIHRAYVALNRSVRLLTNLNTSASQGYLARVWDTFGVGVVLPTLIVMTTVTTTVGIMGFIGWPFNLLNSNMPIILMVIALADSIHLVVAFYRARHAGEEPAEAAQTAIRKHLKPCLYTTLTTAFGFLALASSKLAPVQEFGLAMPIGVVLALIFSVFLLPAMLSFVKSVPKLSPSRDGFIIRYL
ncbi:MAG: MMPL family transporter, partial [Gammaproteobacteria bacterium]|nr:MMPL family transporter [Gammaproteobacteria bacterium]